jgi:YfiH family protein
VFLRTGTAAQARIAFTDRYGGVSSGPYAELNLGGHVGDDPAAVLENRHRVAAALGLDGGRLTFLRQVHGTHVVRVDEPWPSGVEPPEADAVVSATPGLGLAVLVADCTPVLLADRGSSGAIGAVHAGRRGMAAGVVTATVEAMRGLGARPRHLVAVVGPAICGSCYEVSAELQDEVVALAPAARATSRHGTPALDIRAGVTAELIAAGVRTIEAESWCTAERSSLYSHRRDGVSGRTAGIVHLPEGPAAEQPR